MYHRDNGPMTFLNSEVTTEGRRFKITQNNASRRLKSEKMTDDWMKKSHDSTVRNISKCNFAARVFRKGDSEYLE